MKKRKAAPGQGNGSKVRPESKTTVFDKLESTADEAHASLMERAASVLGKSIFRNKFLSPEVGTIEEALRVLMLDAAAFHRYRANHFRKDAGFLFQDRKAA